MPRDIRAVAVPGAHEATSGAAQCGHADAVRRVQLARRALARRAHEE